MTTPEQKKTWQALKGLREARGLSQRALGAAVGVSGEMIRQYENGATPGADKLADLARALDVSVQDLLEASGDGGSSRPTSDPALPQTLARKHPEPEEADLPAGAGRMTRAQLKRYGLIRIPVLSLEASAGPPADVWMESFDDDGFIMSAAEARAMYGVPPEDLQILPVRGTSMVPTLSPGDRALVARVYPGTLLRDGAIYALTGPEGLQIKRLRFDLESTSTTEVTRYVWVVSDNRESPTFRVPAPVFERDYRVAAILLDVRKPI